jgi:hypothetical protein
VGYEQSIVDWYAQIVWTLPFLRDHQARHPNVSGVVSDNSRRRCYSYKPPERAAADDERRDEDVGQVALLDRPHPRW